MGVHGDQQDTGHQDEEEEDPPHPSAGHATHHSDESANKQKGKIMLVLADGRERVSRDPSISFASGENVLSLTSRISMNQRTRLATNAGSVIFIFSVDRFKLPDSKGLDKRGIKVVPH